MAARRGLVALGARALRASDALTMSEFSSSRLLACESGFNVGIRGSESPQSSPPSSPSIAAAAALRSISSSTSSTSSSSSSSSSPTARTYTERKLFAYPPHQVFDVVADVQHYDLFVPWCVRSTVLRVGGGGGSGSGESGGGSGESKASDEEEEEEGRKTTAEEGAPAAALPCSGKLEMEAELVVGFRNFSERYTSNVTLTPPSSVLTTASGSSLFRHLDCRWRFAEGPLPQRTTWVSFSVSFEFRSAVHRHLAGVFFDDVVRRMVTAFEGRCAELYGAPNIGRRRRRGGAAAASAAVEVSEAGGGGGGGESRGKVPA